MDQITNTSPSSPLRIGIIGAGFSGTGLAAMLYRLSDRPLEIILFDKSGQFGAGDAYSTPFHHHILNVRAKDMSAFEDEPYHFVNWLNANQSLIANVEINQSIADTFVPRMLYRHYLKNILDEIKTSSNQSVSLKLESAEVVDAVVENNQVKLVLKDASSVLVDKAVLALGNNPPAMFPFPVATGTNTIPYPWDYTAVQKIDKNQDVLIVGMGLSMIDTVLTLYHQGHKGKIYAISRHGLLPLPHAEGLGHFEIEHQQLPSSLRVLTRYLRLTGEKQIADGGNWRAMINALRVHLPAIWSQATLSDKKRFIRHIMPYWNIHRHRVHDELTNLLSSLSSKQQLKMMSGRVIKVEEQLATIKLRHANNTVSFKIDWLINCMGPTLKMGETNQPIVKALIKQRAITLDPLELGFAVTAMGAIKEPSGEISSSLYTLGPPTKGEFWECTAVPEIRKQSFRLARHLLSLD